MDNIWLKTFVEIVNEGSFKGAAEKMYTSNATISLRMTNLAEELKFDPFIKKRGEIILSERGMELLTVAREMLILEEKIERMKKPESRIEHLRIGTGSSMLVQNLLQPVMRFRNAYPDVDIALEVWTAQEIMERLRRGTLDMGITWDKVEDENLIQDPLGDMHLCAVFLQDHPLFGKQEVTMEELLQYPMILREKNAIARKAPEDWMARHNKRAKVLLTLRHSDHIIKTLASGYGGRYAIGIITSLSIGNTNSGYGLARIRNLPQMQMFAYTHRSVDGIATRQFIRILRSSWS